MGAVHVAECKLQAKYLTQHACTQDQSVKDLALCMNVQQASHVAAPGLPQHPQALQHCVSTWAIANADFHRLLRRLRPLVIQGDCWRQLRGPGPCCYHGCHLQEKGV